MIQATTNSSQASDSVPKEIKEFKDDALAPKGKTKHIVETDWPVKEVANSPLKKKKIKKIKTARLP